MPRETDGRHITASRHGASTPRIEGVPSEQRVRRVGDFVDAAEMIGRDVSGRPGDLLPQRKCPSSDSDAITFEA